jgi:hypothetical protein
MKGSIVQEAYERNGSSPIEWNRIERNVQHMDYSGISIDLRHLVTVHWNLKACVFSWRVKHGNDIE